MRDGALSIERSTVGSAGVDVLKLSGPLTLATLFDLQESLRQDPKQKTIIDLAGVPYIDSAGLGALLSFHASCQRAGRVYLLAGLAPRVRTMFTASKVDRLVHIALNLAEAEAHFAS